MSSFADLIATVSSAGIVTAAWWANTKTNAKEMGDLGAWVGQRFEHLAEDGSSSEAKAHLQLALAQEPAPVFRVVMSWDSQPWVVAWQASRPPIALGAGAELLLVGHLETAAVAQPLLPPDSLSCEQLQSYGERLNQITRNIRWTLDLETIWRQTVDGLGELFAIDHCSICTYEADPRTIEVAAEYHRGQGQRPEAKN